MQYSVHRALGELKLIDKKIIKNKENSYVGLKKNSADNEYETHLSVEQFEDMAKANLQSTLDLIKLKKNIKKAIVKSNAETTVVIAGQEYSVADAIERKNLIKDEENLLLVLKHQYDDVRYDINSNNDKVERNLEVQLSNFFGKDIDRKSVV